MAEPEDSELEELKRRRMEELREAAARGEEERRRSEQEALKRALVRVTFTPEARQRLANIRLVRPRLAEQLENTLIQLAQQGKLKTPVTDGQLKSVLLSIQAQKRDITITRL